MKIKINTWLLPCRSYIRKWLLFVFLVLVLPQPALGAKNIQKDIQDNIPFSTVIALEKAQKLIDTAKPSQAMDLLEKFKKEQIEEKNQVQPFLLFTLGNLCMEENQPEKAALNYEECLKDEKGADFPPAWLNLAKASYDLGRFKKAGDCFIRGYELEQEKRSVILYYASNAFFSAKKYTLALEAFNRLTKDHPDEIEPRWHELTVHILMELKRPEKALPHMEFLAENLEGQAKIRWQETLLYHYMTLGMDEKALKFVSFLTEEYPLEPRWWRGVARLNLDKNNLTKALSAMRIYGFLTPLTDEEKRLVADLYLSVGIPSRAFDMYEQIPVQEKRVGSVKNTIAALQQMNLDEKALEFLDKVINKKPESDELKILKGNLLFSMEKFEESANLFEAVAPRDDSGRSWLMLGYSLWNLGEIKSAQKAMTRAVAFKQQEKAANLALKALKKPLSF